MVSTRMGGGRQRLIRKTKMRRRITGLLLVREDGALSEKTVLIHSAVCFSLGCCIFAQLLVSHKQLLSLLEGLADGVALIDGLDRRSSDVLDGCY